MTTIRPTLDIEGIDGQGKVAEHLNGTRLAVVVLFWVPTVLHTDKVDRAVAAGHVEKI